VANRQDKRPIWAIPEPADRKPGHSREAITRAALRIADTEGFEAVTMKRVAAELGAATMTLYYYVRGKADVVALMQDAILAEVVIPAGELPAGWRAATAAIAARTRQVLLAHPWSLSALNDAQFGPNAARHFEQSLAATAGIGLSTAARMELIAAVDDYVAGNALHAVESMARARAAAADPEMVAATMAYWRGRLRAEDFPELTALERRGADSGDGPPMTEDALGRQFERGLTALLDGVAKVMGIA
jgi:AcrR family transcriptional regulator